MSPTEKSSGLREEKKNNVQTCKILIHRFEMSGKTRPSDEVSPLLVAESSHDENEASPVRCAISTEGITRSRLVLAIGLTWLGSFLAALGTLSLPPRLARYPVVTKHL